MKTQACTAPEPTESYRNSRACVVGGGGIANVLCTVIPRLTKIIRSGITFVSRNLR